MSMHADRPARRTAQVIEVLALLQGDKRKSEHERPGCLNNAGGTTPKQTACVLSRAF